MKLTALTSQNIVCFDKRLFIDNLVESFFCCLRSGWFFLFGGGGESKQSSSSDQSNRYVGRASERKTGERKINAGYFSFFLLL